MTIGYTVAGNTMHLDEATAALLADPRTRDEIRAELLRDAAILARALGRHVQIAMAHCPGSE